MHEVELELNGTSTSMVPRGPRTIAPWLRRLASRRHPIVAIFHQLGFAFDGRRIHVRVIGLATHTASPEQSAKKRARKRFYIRKQATGVWHVLDRLRKHATGAAIVAMAMTKKQAQRELGRIKKANDLLKKQRAIDREKRHNQRRRERRARDRADRQAAMAPQ